MRIKHLMMMLWNRAHFPVGKKSKGVTITGKTIILDWNTLENCELADCELVYLGLGPSTLENSKITGGNFAFDGPAARAVRFLNALERQSPEIVRATFPIAFGGVRP